MNLSRHMRVAMVVVVLAVSAALPGQSRAACDFDPGTAHLVAMVGAGVVGSCTEAVRIGSSGDRTQATTTGLVVIRRFDGRAAFTDGYRTWVDGPSGVVSRLNSTTFAWEVTTTVAPTPSPTPGLTLDTCLRLPVGAAEPVVLRCVTLMKTVIAQTASRSPVPTLRPNERVILRDRSGLPLAHIDDGVTAYRYDGTPMFTIYRERVHDFDGTFLGWFIDGWVRDRSGNAVFGTDTARGGPPMDRAKPEPVALSRRPHPPLGRREIPPLEPIFTMIWADPTRFGLPGS